MADRTLSDSELRAVEDVLSFIRCKCRLGDEEWNDFHSWVWVRLAQTDYEVLRKFERRGSLRKYLAIVLHRLLLDYRVAKWGKWRPSSRARTIGPDAERLEFYIQREGFPVGQAVQMVKLNHGSERSEEDLARIASSLPFRSRQREQPEDWLDRLASLAPTPFESMKARELEADKERAVTVLQSSLSRRQPEERVILKMRFEQGCKLNEIAIALGLKPKRFYRKFERLLRALRRELESHGVDADGIKQWFPDTPARRSFTNRSVSIGESRVGSQLEPGR